MKAKMNNVRGGGIASKKLLAAIAVLAVAFAVFAAVPVIADDSDAADGKTIYVDPTSGNDENDGTSSAKALKTFDAAFDKATANDKVQLVSDYTPTAATAGENDITIPAGETLVVPTGVKLDCSAVKLTVEGTLEVTGTLTIDRQNIAGADKTGACDIVINAGATVKMGGAEVIGPSALTGGAVLVISKLEPAAAGETEAHGYTATLKSGKLTLGTADSTFTVGANTNLTIDKDAEVELNGAITFDEGDEKSKGSITNNGTLTISASGSVDTTNGTLTNNGTVVLNKGATFTGTISGGTVSGTADYYPTMTERTKYVDADGIVYFVFHYDFKNQSYQYGLSVKDIAYDGTPISDDELNVFYIALPDEKGTELTFQNTASGWKEKYDDGGDLAIEGAPNAGTYEGVVRYTASISAAGGAFTNTTITKYLDLVVTPAEYTGKITIKDWNFGDYNEKDNGPSLSVEDKAGNKITEGYTVTYEFFTDEKCTESKGTDPLALQPGTYYVKATVTTDSPNYKIDITNNKCSFKVVRASEVEFHPIQDLKDPETEKAILGGVDPNAIQESIKFNDMSKDKDGKYNLRVTGAVNKIAAKIDDKINPTFTKLAGLFDSDAPTEGGYFLAFYISGADGKKLTDKDVSIVMKTLVEADCIASSLDVPKEFKNEKGYVFGILYISELQADKTDGTAANPAPGQNGFNCDVDYDGNGVVYNTTKYLVDTSFLNYYTIVLHDDKADDAAYYNDTLTYYRLNDAKFTLPSGAAEGFKYWATEKGVINDRVFSFGSIMVVGDKYDADDDKTIDLYATYGSGSEPTPVEPTKGKIVVTGFVQDGKAYFTVIADDGLAIPAGKLIVSYTYDDPDFGADTGIKTFDVESAQFATIAVDVPEGAITIFANYDDVKSNVFFI